MKEFSICIYGERTLDIGPSRILWNNFYSADNPDDAVDKAKKDFLEKNPKYAILLWHYSEIIIDEPPETVPPQNPDLD